MSNVAVDSPSKDMARTPMGPVVLRDKKFTGPLDRRVDNGRGNYTGPIERSVKEKGSVKVKESGSMTEPG